MLYTAQDGFRKGRFSDNVMVEVYDELEPLKNEPVFKKSKKKVVSREEKFRILSHAYHNKYKQHENGSNKSTSLIKEKIDISQKTPAKPKPLNVQTATVTPTNPSTARRTQRELQLSEQNRNNLFSIREHKK